MAIYSGETVNDAIEKGLKDLKVGTDEYKSALEKANEQAKALIEKHKLYGQFTYGENGLVNIDKDALGKALKDSSDKATQAEAAAYGAEIYSNQAKLIDQATDAGRILDKEAALAHPALAPCGQYPLKVWTGTTRST